MESKITVLVCYLLPLEDPHANYYNGDTKLYNETLHVACSRGYKLKMSTSNNDTTTVIRCLDTGFFNLTPICDRKGKIINCNKIKTKIMPTCMSSPPSVRINVGM